MDARERTFALTISGVHGVDHLLKRLFPPLVPIWALAFGYPLWKIGLLIGVNTFGAAIGQAPMGILSDRYDRRYLLPAGIAVMGGGIVVLAAAPSVGVFGVETTVFGYAVDGQLLAMLSAMLAIGLGSSVVHPAGYPLITANVREEAKGKALGMWGSASKFGDGVAPALLGVLLLGLAWSEILTLVGVLGVGYAAVLFVLLRNFETRPAEAQPAASGDGGAGDAWRRDNRLYVYPLLAVFAYFVVQIVASSGIGVFLPEFIASTYGYSTSIFGVTFTPESTASFYYSALLLVAGVTQLGTGELVDRYDNRRIILAHLGVALVALLVLAGFGLPPWSLLVVLVVLGAGLWGVNPARDALVSDITPAEREGRTFGYIWTGALLLSSGAPVVVGYIGDVAGLREAFALLAGILLLSGVPIALLMSDRVYVTVDESRGARAD